MPTDIGLLLDSKQGDNPGTTHKLIHCFVVERCSGPAKNTQHLNATYYNLAAAQHAAHVCLPCCTMRVSKHAHHAVHPAGGDRGGGGTLQISIQGGPASRSILHVYLN